MCKREQMQFEQFEQSAAFQNYIKQRFICPFTKDVVKNPVTIIPSGQICERNHLDSWVKNQMDNNDIPKCPVTQQPIDKYVTSPDIKNIVDHYWQIKAVVPETKFE